jgi:hypothetical protein
VTVTATRICKLTGYHPQATDAVLEVDELTADRRLGRALAGFGAWLGAAVVCVFIPIAHFVLVPACLVGAVVVLISRLRARALVVRAHGVCPDCGTEQDLDVLGPWRGTVRSLACRACHRGLELRPS